MVHDAFGSRCFSSGTSGPLVEQMCEQVSAVEKAVTLMNGNEDDEALDILDLMVSAPNSEMLSKWDNPKCPQGSPTTTVFFCNKLWLLFLQRFFSLSRSSPVTWCTIVCLAAGRRELQVHGSWNWNEAHILLFKLLFIQILPQSWQACHLVC